MADYNISLGLKKFGKVFLIAFGTGWAALHAAGISLFAPNVAAPLIEGALLAGLVYALDNYRKHRK